MWDDTQNLLVILDAANEEILNLQREVYKESFQKARQIHCKKEAKAALEKRMNELKQEISDLKYELDKVKKELTNQKKSTHYYKKAFEQQLDLKRKTKISLESLYTNTKYKNWDLIKLLEQVSTKLKSKSNTKLNIANQIDQVLESIEDEKSRTKRQKFQNKRVRENNYSSSP